MVDETRMQFQTQLTLERHESSDAVLCPSIFTGRLLPHRGSSAPRAGTPAGPTAPILGRSQLGDDVSQARYRDPMRLAKLQPGRPLECRLRRSNPSASQVERSQAQIELAILWFVRDLSLQLPDRLIEMAGQSLKIPTASFFSVKLGQQAEVGRMRKHADHLLQQPYRPLSPPRGARSLYKRTSSIVLLSGMILRVRTRSCSAAP